MVVNSSPLSAAYMRQWIGSALVKIMNCSIFGAKSSSNQCWVVVNSTLGNKPRRNFDQNTKLYLSRKCIWKYRLRNDDHFVHGRLVNVIDLFNNLHMYISWLDDKYCWHRKIWCEWSYEWSLNYDFAMVYVTQWPHYAFSMGNVKKSKAGPLICKRY